MKLIPLNGQIGKGKFVKVDDEDYDWLNQYNWFASRGTGDTIYAARSQKVKVGKWTCILMHRMILKITETSGIMGDHIDGDGLNNQRNNLRVATNGQNQANARKFKSGQSIYKGVRKYVSEKGVVYYKAITSKRINGKLNYLYKYTSNLQAAALIYNELAKEFHGEFARINILTPDDEILYKEYIMSLPKDYEKKCPGCNVIKNKDDFPNSSSTTDGKWCYCRECTKKRNKIDYERAKLLKK